MTIRATVREILRAPMNSIIETVCSQRASSSGSRVI